MQHWLKAMRLRTLPLAVASIGMGAFLAASRGAFRLDVFIMALLTTLLLQILSNLANDYGDSIHGADHSDREGPDRAVQSGAISKKQMIRAIMLFVALTLVSGVTLLLLADLSYKIFYAFLALGFIAIVAAILYTNGYRPYGYMGLGDISVFVFFGWLGVLGTYYLMAGDMSWDLLLPGSACGLFTVGVLNLNNIRDIDSDLIAGKLSIPARLGRHRANVYHIALLVAGLLCAALYTILHYQQATQLLFLVVVPLLYLNIRAVLTKLNPRELDPYLKQMALSTLIFVLFFGIGIIL